MELKTFGERLFWARHNHARITQIELGKRMEEQYQVKIGRNYISQIENGEDVYPTFDVVRAMAAVCQVSLDFLAGFTKEFAAIRPEEHNNTYISEEAEEMAKLVDAMHPSQRQVLVTVAKNMLIAPTRRQLRRADIRDMLDSVDEQMGGNAREQIEQIMRDNGLLVDDDS